jgi:IS605 OrfB family transposase
MRRTLKCKLDVSPKDQTLLLKTLSIYASACNHLAKIAIENNIRRRYDLHKLAYYSTRKQFNLPSQLTCTAIWKVVETVKSNKRRTVPSFSPTASMRLNYPRNFSFDYPNISLTTLNGRVKVKIAGCYNNLLEELLRGKWQITESHLSYNRHTGFFYFNLGLKADNPPMQEGLNPIGVDLGVKRIAVVSTGRFFHNKQTLHIKHKYDYLRKHLQRKETKSAKRHLKKLARKIGLFQRDVNHKISKEITSIAQSIPNSIVVFENLKHIRKNTTVRKKQRKDHSRWSFCELQTFTGYKAEGIGISTAYVNPRGTSHTCSRCGSTNVSRNGVKFLCHSCGLLLDADFNASLNIASRYILETKADYKPANRNLFSELQALRFIVG